MLEVVARMFKIDIKDLGFSIDISQEELDRQLSEFNQKKSFRKFHGFNTSVDKSVSNLNEYFMTDYVAGYHEVKNPKTGRRNKKPIYKPLFESLHSAFKCASGQRQVFTGLNHLRRDLVVADVDCHECLHSQDQQWAIDHIFKTCECFDIPFPSYVEFHNDSGHYQIGWYLEEYFVNYGYDNQITSEYRILTRWLAELFGGDSSFKGGNIKNPFHVLNTAYFFNLEKLNVKNLFERVERAYNSFNKIENPNTLVGFFEHGDKNDHLYGFDFSIEKSRNCYAYKATIGWVFSYMRSHNDMMPSQSEIEYMFSLFEIESLQYNGKPHIEDAMTIKRSAEGVAAFCSKHYDRQKASKFALKCREVSLTVRQANQAINFFKIKFLIDNQKMSQSKIARKIACSQATVHNILQKPQKEYIDYLKKYQSTFEHSKDSSKKEILGYTEYILKNLRYPKKYPLCKIFPELIEN